MGRYKTCQRHFVPTAPQKTSLQQCHFARKEVSVSPEYAPTGSLKLEGFNNGRTGVILNISSPAPVAGEPAIDFNYLTALRSHGDILISLGDSLPTLGPAATGAGFTVTGSVFWADSGHIIPYDPDTPEVQFTQLNAAPGRKIEISPNGLNNIRFDEATVFAEIGFVEPHFKSPIRMYHDHTQDHLAYTSSDCIKKFGSYWQFADTGKLLLAQHRRQTTIRIGDLQLCVRSGDTVEVVRTPDTLTIRCLSNEHRSASYVETTGQRYELNPSEELSFSGSGNFDPDDIARRNQKLTRMRNFVLRASELSLPSILQEDSFIKLVCQQSQCKQIHESILRLAACLFVLRQNRGPYSKDW